MSRLNFCNLGIFRQFCPIKVTCLVTLFYLPVLGFQKLCKSAIFGLFSFDVKALVKKVDLDN